MVKRFFSAVLFSFLAIVSYANDTSLVTKRVVQPGEDNAGLKLPAGFAAAVVADSLGKARHIVTTAQGAIYVKLDKLIGGKGILRLKDTNGDGKIDDTKGFGTYRGTGIAIKGDYLYASSNDEVYRCKLDKNGEVTNPDAPERIIKGLVNGRQHNTKIYCTG